ncbi:MAG: hypothetical protein F9K18_01240 [Thermoanaerobaculia bacterium]|nr:MAG: hypothetical protein F9K18_01240 [Thermoanaerobaculia bacterium]
MILALTAAALGVLLVWCFLRWRAGVQMVLVLLVAEGAIRKWVLPGQQQLVYLAKDLLLIAVYAGWFTSVRRKSLGRVPVMVVLPLLACAVWGAVEIFNPRLPSLLVGLFGWKAYFLYAPLLWVVPAAFRDMPDLERFARWYAYLLIPETILGYLQSRSAASSPLNRYAWGEAAAGSIATFGEAGSPVRVTGSFSYISGYVSFLTVAGLLTLALLAARRFSWRGNILLWATLGALPFGILFSGSRAPVILLAGIAPLFVMFASGHGGRRVDTLARLAAGLALVTAIVSFTGAPALEAFARRARTATDLQDRLLTPFVEPFRIAEEVGLLGYGIGATHQAAASLVPDLRPGAWLEGLEAENESSRVMIELGPFGFVFHYSYRIGMILMVFGWARRSRSPFGRAVGFAAALFLTAQLPGASVMNVTNGMLFWFLAGCAHLTALAEEQMARGASAFREAEAPSRSLDRAAEALGQ